MNDSLEFRRSAIFYGVALVLALYVLAVGAFPQRSFALDLFQLVGGGWHVVYGDRPYIDFHTLFGPLLFFIIAAGIQLTGGTTETLPVAILLATFVLCSIGHSVFRTWIRGWVGLVLSLFLLILCLSPMPLHFLYYRTSYAMIYNRFGYAVLIILLAMVCGDPVDSRSRRKGELIMGALVMVLLFFKVSYFVAALGFPLFAIAMRGADLRWILAGAVPVFLLFFAYLGTDGFLAMLGDYGDAGAVRAPAVFAASLRLVLLELPLFGIALILFMLRLKQRNWDEFAAVLVIAAVAEIGGFHGYQFLEVPLFGAYTLILLKRSIHEGNRDLDKLGKALVAYAVILPFINGLGGLLTPLGFLPMIENRPVEKLESTSFPAALQKTEWCAPAVNEGIALLSRHPETEHRIIGHLFFADPFSFTLHRRPARYLPLSFSMEAELNDRVHPSAEHIFQDCDYVMVPKDPETDLSIENAKVLSISEVLWGHDPIPEMEVRRGIPEYDRYLSANYVELDESKLWILLKRRNE